MVGCDVHAVIKIKAVGGETLDAGIQRQIIAAIFLRVLDEPIEERGAEAAGAIDLVGDEIVDVKGAA